MCRVLLIFFLSFYGFQISGQVNGLNTLIEFDETPVTIDEVLNQITVKYDISFSYSSNQFSLKSKIRVPPSPSTLRKTLKTAFYRYNVKLKEIDEGKVLITAQLKPIRIYGVIRDKSSGELLAGSLVINSIASDVQTANETGQYSLEVRRDTIQLEYRLLGYHTETVIFEHDGTDINKDIYLQFENVINPIIIRNNIIDNLLFDPGAERITVESSFGHVGITGEKDILFDIKMKEGIASGTEGTLGLNINGGNSDENLFLLDGVPIYEVSHVAGINSIFQEESINSVHLIKNGIPARYGGRMSSVVNIHLKEGHFEKPKRSVSLGLTTASFGFEGPLGKGKTTFNLAGRTSLFNYTFGPVINKFSSFEGVNLGFQDLVGKITHRFSNKTKISLTTYLGGDRTKLTQSDTLISSQSYYRSRDLNEIRWGNKLAALNFSSTLNSKSTLHFNVGWTQYNFFSQGYYELESRFDTISLDQTVNVVSRSDVEDLQAGLSLDFYISEKIKTKFGATGIRHRFQPTIKQSFVVIDSTEAVLTKPDSIIQSNELALYGELNIKLGKYFYLYPGLHYNTYNVEESTYQSLQPRLRVIFKPFDKTVVSSSYGRLTQNLHLLSKPGIGIASDLWVPSTNNIKPSTVDQFDIQLSQYFLKDYTFTASYYNKNYTNLIEYSVPVDLHANVIISDDRQIFFKNDNDWRRRLDFGEGKSKGFTLSIRKEKGNTKGWVSYHYNQFMRKFDSIDEGEFFPARHERPHDINVGLNHEFNDRFVLAADWIFTSGGTFSLSNEEFVSVGDVKLLRPDSRNNYRLPNYHRLSVGGQYKFELMGTNAQLKFGVNNIYNRLNPFFLYVTKNPESDIPVIKKVTLFPALPFINISWTW